MDYFITGASYHCIKNVFLISANNDDILKDKLYITNAITNDVAKLTLITKGEYSISGINPMPDGPIYITSFITGVTYNVFVKKCENCENPPDIVEIATCKKEALPELCDGVVYSDDDVFYVSLTGKTMHCNGCDNYEYFSMTSVEKIWPVGVIFIDLNDAITQYVFTVIVYDTSTGCAKCITRVQNISTGPRVVPSISYSCKNGLLYNTTDIGVTYKKCSDIPPVGTKLANGTYKYCVSNNCDIYTLTVNVRCPYVTPTKAQCYNRYTDFFDYKILEQKDDYCFNYKIINKGYNLKIELISSDKEEGSCKDILSSRINTIYGTFTYTKNDKEIIINPYENPIAASHRFPIIIRVTILDSKVECSFDICAVKCQYPGLVSPNKLKPLIINSYKINGEERIQIKNPLYNGLVKLDIKNMDYKDTLSGGKSILIKNPNNQNSLRYNILNPDTGYSLTTTINLPKTVDPPSGILYIDSSNGMMSVKTT